MATKAAFIYIAPENDYKVHKAFIDSPVVNLMVVGVKTYDEAEVVTRELVADGITAIELCAGFGNDDYHVTSSNLYVDSKSSKSPKS